MPGLYHPVSAALALDASNEARENINEADHCNDESLAPKLPGGVGVARQPLELKSLVRIQAGQPPQTRITERLSVASFS